MLATPEEDFAEVVALRHLLHLGTRVGNGDEMVARRVLADCLLHSLKKILLEDIWLQRAAGLAGHDAQRPRQIDLAFNRI